MMKKRRDVVDQETLAHHDVSRGRNAVGSDYKNKNENNKNKNGDQAPTQQTKTLRSQPFCQTVKGFFCILKESE